MRDQFNRDINYLRLSVTDRCNLRCIYCLPEFSKDFIDESKLLTTDEYFRLIRILGNLGIKKVRITGGEPLVRKGIPGLVKKINSLENIEETAMTTNGILLEKYIDELAENGLSSLNISLDVLDEKKYNYVTRGGELEKVINSIEKAIGYKIKIKINSVIIDGFNKDNIKSLVDFAVDKNIDIRFIELMPIGCGKELKGVSNAEILDIVAKDRKILETDTKELISGPAKYHKIAGTNTKLGFISPLSNCFCETCNRIRITSEGKLKQCLYYDSKLDLMKMLRTESSDKKLMEEIKNEIYFKNKQHNFTGNAEDEEKDREKNTMSVIGG
jgi:cyclic pyranopterin phosphate synthase